MERDTIINKKECYVCFQNSISKKYNSIVAAGMCVASYFLDELDPATNHTISVWVPASKVIINTEVDPPTAYFVARNNVTVSYYFPYSHH